MFMVSQLIRKKLFFFIFLFCFIFAFITNGTLAIFKDARFYFEKDLYEIPSNCEYTIRLIIDTGSNQSNAADVIINYNPNEIEIIDNVQNVNGVQIGPGNAYEYYPVTGNIVDSTNGIIRLVGVSYDKILRGKSVFANIKVKLKSNFSNLNIVFDGTDKTTDSNIAEYNSSIDILSQVKSTQLKKSNSTSCSQEDTIPPDILVNSNYSDMKNTNKLKFFLSDNFSGMDLNTLKVIIGEATYYYSQDSSVFNIIPQENGYLVELILTNNFNLDNQLNFAITVSDKSGNQNSINTNLSTEKQNITQCNCPVIDYTKKSDGDNNEFANVQNQYHDMNKQIFGLLPQSLSFVSDSGVVSPLALAITLPIAYFILTLISSFLGGGFLIPFLASIFRRRGNIKVIDSISKEGIPFVRVRVYQRGFDKIIKQYVTSPFGTLDFDLYQGFYILEFEKHGYETARYELNNTDSKNISLVLVMESKERENKTQVFDAMLKIASIVAVILAFINFLMMLNFISFLIFIVVLLSVFLYNYLFNSSR